MLLVAVWFVVSFFFRDVGSNPTECTFCSLNFEKNTSVSIPLHLECIVHFKFDSYRSLQNAKFILTFSWKMTFFLFLQNRYHHSQLIKWLPRDLYNPTKPQLVMNEPFVSFDNATSSPSALPLFRQACITY